MFILSLANNRKQGCVFWELIENSKIMQKLSISNRNGINGVVKLMLR